MGLAVFYGSRIQLFMTAYSHVAPGGVIVLDGHVPHRALVH